MSDEHITHMATTGFTPGTLPPGIVRWRVNRKRPDGSWANGDWIEGQPSGALPHGDLLEYDVRQLTPRRVTILGDRVKDWPPEDPPAFLGERIVAALRGGGTRP